MNLCFGILIFTNIDAINNSLLKTAMIYYEDVMESPNEYLRSDVRCFISVCCIYRFGKRAEVTLDNVPTYGYEGGFNGVSFYNSSRLTVGRLPNGVPTTAFP